MKLYLRKERRMVDEHKAEEEKKPVKPPTEPPKALKQKPGVGRIVLARVNDGSDRPMMIVKVINPNEVNGVIFLDGWNDRGLANPGTREGLLLAWATSLKRGSEVNQWRFYDD
jgi:hypothetical protein